jgi:hypothetical protein
MIGLAGLAFAPLLFASEPELPLWMVGEWCPGSVGHLGLQSDTERTSLAIRFQLGDLGPGPHCMQWREGADGTLIGTQTYGYSGRNDSGEVMTISVVRGKLRYDHETAWLFFENLKPDGRYRMVSRGPQAFLVERIGRGSPWRIRYSREYNLLMVTSWPTRGGKPWRWTYFQYP